jgi:hypothetical protein
LASPAVRAVRTACFTEQMEQKKAVAYHARSEKLPPSFSSIAEREALSKKNISDVHQSGKTQQKMYARTIFYKKT